MQKVIREQGKRSMDEEVYESFAAPYREGTLVDATLPAGVMARFVVAPDASLSGLNLK